MEEIVIPVWGLVTFMGGIVIAFVTGWIKVRVDLGRLHERMSDVEEQHAKIPQIWKTINNMRVDMGKMETTLDGMKHTQRNNKNSLDILLAAITKIDKDLAKLTK